MSITGNSIAEFSPSASGLAGFSFTVTDADGTSISKNIGVFVGITPLDEPFNYDYYKDRALTQLVSVSPTGITKIKNDEISEISSFPNPVISTITVKFESRAASNADFIIYDISGAELYREKIQVVDRMNNLTFNLSNLKPGAYSLKIVSASINKNLKFIKK